MQKWVYHEAARSARFTPRACSDLLGCRTETVAPNPRSGVPASRCRLRSAWRVNDFAAGGFCRRLQPCLGSSAPPRNFRPKTQNAVHITIVRNPICQRLSRKQLPAPRFQTPISRRTCCGERDSKPQFTDALAAGCVIPNPIFWAHLLWGV